MSSQDPLRSLVGTTQDDSLQTPPVLPVAGASAPDDRDRIIRLLLQGDEEPEDTDLGFKKGLQSAAAGAVVGVLDPFTAIPLVRSTVDRLRRYKPTEGLERVPYALGWLAGSLLPFSAAMKVGGYGARGLGYTVKTAEALKAGDMAADLTRAGLLVRGGITGALLEAGNEAEDVSEYFKDIATNAALFGVGDVALHVAGKKIASLYRATRGNSLYGQSKEEILATVDAVEAALKNEGVQTVGESELLARGLSTIDDIIEKETPKYTSTFLNDKQVAEIATRHKLPESIVRSAASLPESELATRVEALAQATDPEEKAAASMYAEILKRAQDPLLNVEGIESRRISMQLGLRQLGLDEVGPGTMKIVQGVGGSREDMLKVLENLGGYDAQFIERTITAGGRKVKVVDAVVSRKGELDRQAIFEYGKQGFITGQEAIWKGKKRLLVKDAGNEVVAFTIDGTVKTRPHMIPKEELSLLPIVHRRTTAGLDMNKLFSEFVSINGLYPNFLEQGQRVGFSGKFEAFAATRNIAGRDKIQLKNFIAQKQREGIKNIDPELFDALERINKNSVGAIKGTHTEGILAETAAMKGFLSEIVPTGEFDEKGLAKWAVQLINHRNGDVMRFKGKEEALTFLKSYGVDAPELVPTLLESPIAEGAIAAVEGGVSVVPAHTAHEIGNAKIPFWTLLMSGFRPREGMIRLAEDRLRQEGVTVLKRKVKNGKDIVTEEVALNLWGGVEKTLPDGTKITVGGFDKVREGMGRMRNWLNGKYAPEGQVPVDWIGRLTKMKGSRHRTTSVRDEKMESLVDIFQRPRTEWADLGAKAGLNKREMEVLGEARSYLNDIFERLNLDPNNKITGEMFIEDYFPHIANRSSAKSKEFMGKARRANPEVMDFVHELERHGAMVKYDKDLFRVLMRYTRAAAFRMHVTRHWKETAKMVEAMLAEGKYANPQLGNESVQGGMGVVAKQLKDYLLMSYGGMPETYYVTREALSQMVENLNLKLSPMAFDRVVQTMVSANFGAYMGFRPGLALRNLSQLIVTTLPMVGAKNMSAGLESAARNYKPILEKLRKYGGEVSSAAPVATEDVFYTHQVHDAVKNMTGPGARESAVKGFFDVGERVTDFTHWSLGMFSKMDQFNRVVTFAAQRNKTITSLNRYLKGEIKKDKFDELSGLFREGETVAAEFHRRLSVNQDDAIDWFSTYMSNQTQWLYQLGAGPSAFSHGFGKLFGMYGTWPTWFAQYVSKGMTKGTTADKIQFLGWTSAVTGLFTSSAYWTGLNLSRWTGFSSFEWAGSPFWDWAKDATDIWGGVQSSGEPTAERTLALGERGMRDTGSGIPLLGLLPGGRLDIKDPRKLFDSTVGMFTPGLYALRDGEQTLEAMGRGDAAAALREFFNLTEAKPTGSTFPEMNFK